MLFSPSRAFFNHVFHLHIIFKQELDILVIKYSNRVVVAAVWIVQKVHISDEGTSQ